ncbi:hypothetical protein [Cellulomonas hominis]
MTTALAKLERQLQDVDNLIERHPSRSGPPEDRPTRRPLGEHGPLLRSCVLLTYAAWEVYAEDSVVAAVKTLVTDGSLGQLPTALRDFVAQDADPWSFAGDGWRQVVLDRVILRVRGDETSTSAGTFGINSAGPGQLMKLHEEVFGDRPLNRCSWPGRSTKRVKERLALLVEVRGSIAHTGTTPGNLNLDGTEAWRGFIWRLGEKLDAEIDAIVEGCLG